MDEVIRPDVGTEEIEGAIERGELPGAIVPADEERPGAFRIVRTRSDRRGSGRVRRVSAVWSCARVSNVDAATFSSIERNASKAADWHSSYTTHTPSTDAATR